MKIVFNLNPAYFELLQLTDLTISQLDDALFAALDPQPEDVESKSLDHFPADVLREAAKKLNVSPDDLIGLQIIEHEDLTTKK